MDEPGRKEPYADVNPYADPGAAPSAATTSSPPQAAAPGDPINLFLHKLFHTSPPPKAAAAPSPPLAAAAGEHRYPVEFTASAGEYFRIWIINLALTILTLGIYSAWAKVRKKRYFYGHTIIDGDSFEYRGKPIAILKGRLIAVGAFAVFYGVGRFAPAYQWVLFIAAVFIVPWLLVRSMAFNAYNTAYKNIRLRFTGGYGKCIRILLQYGLYTVITMGLGYSALKARLVEFAARNHRYGTTRFDITDLRKPYLGIYFRAIGVALLWGIGLMVAAMIGVGIISRSSFEAASYSVYVSMAGYVTYLIVFAYWRARIANATFNNLSLGPVHFEFALRARDLFWLYLVNIIAIIVTLGLATPWAAVRTMRYRAEKATVLAAGGLDRFIGAESQQVSAAGEEVGEMFDIDIGL